MFTTSSKAAPLKKDSTQLSTEELKEVIKRRKAASALPGNHRALQAI
jgi:hypothetical protein